MPTLTALRNSLFFCLLLVVISLTACDKHSEIDSEPPEILDLSNPDAPVVLTPPPADDLKRLVQNHPGKRLHDANCISCHDAAIYTRETRKMNDFMQLSAQVRRCNANLAKALTEAELTQITDYLNQAYYKLEP